jgi:hypothetical protein
MLNPVGSIIQLALYIIMLVGSAGMWVAMKNKNNKKDLLAITVLIAVVGVAEQGYYLTGDHRIQRLDGVVVQWEFPIFTGVQAVLLSLASTIFLACDYHAILFIAFKVAFAAFCMTMGYISGDPAGHPDLTHTFWFCMTLGIMVCTYVVSAVYHQRNKDKWGYGIMGFTAFFWIVLGATWLASPQFLGKISGTIDYWLNFVCCIALFVLLPVAINLLQGEEDSVLNKIRGLVDRKMKDKYCGPAGESAPLTGQEDV